jgi:OFA family oxalate/formate antiporter-like MFS transporter
MSFTSNHKRWTVIAGALIVQVILGTVYAFSVFVRPLETEFSWGRTTTQWAFSAALATFALMMIPAGKLQDRIGPRKVATMGGVLLGLSFLLGALLVTEDRPWALYLTYGIIGGAGIGMAYVCPISAAIKWYPDKKGLISGLDRSWSCQRLNRVTRSASPRSSWSGSESVRDRDLESAGSRSSSSTASCVWLRLR